MTHGPALKFSNHLGRDFNHLIYQLDLPVPFKTRLLDVETYLLFRYFDGYGKSLLSYREKSSTIRAGVSLDR